MKCLLARALPLIPPRPCASTHGRAVERGPVRAPACLRGVSATGRAEMDEHANGG